MVAGDRDTSPLTTRGPDWFTDVYALSPGADSLLTLTGAQHSLGGVAGDAVTETTDEQPDRVALLQQLTCAYLRSALRPGDPSWATASAPLLDGTHPLGRVAVKSTARVPA